MIPHRGHEREEDATGWPQSRQGLLEDIRRIGWGTGAERDVLGKDRRGAKRL
jgi:hypothetical protein